MSAATDRAIQAGTRERLRIRSGDFSGPTAGLAAGNVQANLVILPKALAHDFLRFAQANPQALPGAGGFRAGRSPPAEPRRGSRHSHRSAEIPGVARRRTGRGAVRYSPCLARRPGQFRPWLLVFVRAGIGRGRDRAASYDLRVERADVPDQYPLHAGRPVRRPAGRLDAAVGSRRRDPGDSDHLALSVGAWRAGAYRPARGDRHRGSGKARLRGQRPGREVANCRCSGLAGSPRRR